MPQSGAVWDGGYVECGAAEVLRDRQVQPKSIYRLQISTMA